ncbi:MAG: ATP-binding cassette domain-containing protein [Desulfitobacteriaceae bacterium]
MPISKLLVQNISLSVGSESERTILFEDISLKLEAGTIHALLGPSGGGKSSLLYALNRLREIENGRIMLDDQDIKLINVLELRRRVGLVLQKPIFFTGTVGDNLLYGPRLWSKQRSSFLPSKSTGSRISRLIDRSALIIKGLLKSNAENESELLALQEDYLLMVGLEPALLKRDPNTLSGGQQQRLAFARTLANEPEILLLDEPTSALDSEAGQIIEELIKKQCVQQKLSVVWVTHDLRQAQRLAQTVSLIHHGRIVEQAEAKEFFSNPKSPEAKAFLNGGLGEVK